MTFNNQCSSMRGSSVKIALRTRTTFDDFEVQLTLKMTLNQQNDVVI